MTNDLLLKLFAFSICFFALILLDFHCTPPGQMSNTRWAYPDLQQKRTPYGQACVYIDKLLDKLAALGSENERLRLELN